MIKAVILSIFLCFSVGLQAQQDTSLPWLRNWFAAWELVSNKLLRLPADTIPDMLFFDGQFVYTTSAVSAPQGVPFNGPTLSGKKLPWRKAPHAGKIMLPSGEEVPAGLMSFAAPGKEKVFFVMGAPAIWQQAGVTSKELGLDKLLTGVFLHEFAHTRQFSGFGKMMGSFENSPEFKAIATDMNDDIVQQQFGKDTVYEKRFRQEAAKFYEAAEAKDKKKAKALLAEALNMLKQRQDAYFTGEKAMFSSLDDIFLSMEGMGQYVAVAWLIHPRGGKLPMADAVKGFRRNGKQWSQEEGLAAFLALTNIAKINWAEDMFGPTPKTIIKLIENATR